MNARTYAQWVQLGCPLTVAPDGHRAYLPGFTAWLGALDHGLAMVADQPWNAQTPPGEMQEINLTAEPIDRVTLDFSECADHIDAGLVAELLKTADPEAGARSREYWKTWLRVTAQAKVPALPAKFESQMEHVLDDKVVANLNAMDKIGSVLPLLHACAETLLDLARDERAPDSVTSHGS